MDGKRKERERNKKNERKWMRNEEAKKIIKEMIVSFMNKKSLVKVIPLMSGATIIPKAKECSLKTWQ